MLKLIVFSVWERCPHKTLTSPAYLFKMFSSYFFFQDVPSLFTFSSRMFSPSLPFHPGCSVLPYFFVWLKVWYMKRLWCWSQQVIQNIIWMCYQRHLTLPSDWLSLYTFFSWALVWTSLIQICYLYFKNM